MPLPSMRLLPLACAALVVSSCTGGADPRDVRCYAIGEVGMTTDSPTTEDAALRAYYLGRLEASDPSGRWAYEVVDLLSEQAWADVRTDAPRCLEQMRAALLKPVQAAGKP